MSASAYGENYIGMAGFTSCALQQHDTHSGILSGGGVVVAAGRVDVGRGLEVVGAGDCEAEAAVDE
jgi:hypothetical protein